MGRVLHTLTILWRILTKDVRFVFFGTVEVDGTYLWGARRNKRKVIRETGTKRGRGTSKQPVFEILCRNGKVWAEMVNGIGEDTLHPLITKTVVPGFTV